MQLIGYLFWPNPGVSSYGNSLALFLLLVSFALIAASFGIRVWRAKQKNPVTRRLSASWPSAALAFGLVGLLLTVSRVEGIQYVGMRIWWIVLAASAAWYLYFQVRRYQKRHYEVLPSKRVDDPRDPYLPKPKR